jgi:hypothetical protein
VNIKEQKMTSNSRLYKNKITLDEANIRVDGFKIILQFLDTMKSACLPYKKNELLYDFISEYVKSLQNDVQAHRYCLLKQIEKL